MGFRAFRALRTPEISTNLYMHVPACQAIGTWFVRGSDGDPRRSTEVVLNEQALPVASMKSSRSRDARSVMRAKTKLEAMTAVAVLASRAARVVAFRSNLTPCGWGVPETLRGISETSSKPTRS